MICWWKLAFQCPSNTWSFLDHTRSLGWSSTLTWTITSSFDCSKTPSLRISDLGITCCTTKKLRHTEDLEDFLFQFTSRHDSPYFNLWQFIIYQNNNYLALWAHWSLSQTDKIWNSLWLHRFSVWPCPSLSEWVQMNLWRCNSSPDRGKSHRPGKSRHIFQVRPYQY